MNGGVTTLLDWSHINNTPDHSDAAVQGLKDAGIRAVYAHGVPTGGEWWSFSDLDHPEDIRRIARDVLLLGRSAPDARARGSSARATPTSRSPSTTGSSHATSASASACTSACGSTTVHVTHVKNMHDLGLLGPDTTYIHCTDSTDEELDLIASTGGTASIAPYVEMLMGHGPPPTGRLLDRGVRPSLSVDVVSSVPGEMFTQMRTALVYERIGAHTDTPDEAFAPKLTHRDVLEFATIEGARACALEDKVGSLTPKKQADIVLLNVKAINTAPMVDPIGTIVVFSDTSNVDSVFVAGQRGEAQRKARRRRPRDRRSPSSTSRGITSSAKASCCRTGQPRRRQPSRSQYSAPVRALVRTGARSSARERREHGAASSSSAARRGWAVSSRCPTPTRAARWS